MPETSGIFYTDEGKGYPVVLIHGFCETHEIWKNFSKELSKDFRVLSVDLPGFGKSKLLPEGFSITDVGIQLVTWLKSLQVSSCVTIGHSLGGYVALAMAEQQPKLLQAFGLFHSTALADSEEKKESRNKVIEFVVKHGVVPFVESFIPPLFFDQTNSNIQSVVTRASQTRPETLMAYVRAMRDRPNRTAVLKSFAGRVLFIAGEKDNGIPLDSITKQANMTANPVLHTLPLAGHMGMFEAPGRTVEMVRTFVLKESGEAKISLKSQ